MPIDPSIPLSSRPYQPLDFGQTLGQLMQFRGQQQQLEANRLQMEKVRRAEEDDRAIRTAIQRSGGDVDIAIKDLEMGGFAPVAFKLRDTVLEQRKAEAEGLVKRADATKTRMEQVANIAFGITPQNFRESVRAAESLIGPDMAAHFGDVYDEERIKRIRTFGRSATDQVTADRDAATAAFNALKFEQDGLKNAQDFEKERPKILQEWTKAVALSLGNAQSPEDWAARREQIGKGGDFAKEALALLPAEFSPDSVTKAKALGISPEKAADLAAQAKQNAIVNSQNQQRIGLDAQRVAQGNEQLGIARRHLALAEGSPEQQGALADMVLRDPAILDKLTPSERGKTLKFVATERGGDFPNKRAQSAIALLDTAEGTLGQLESRMGMLGGGSGAVGVKGPTSLFGAFSSPIAGTPAADFVSYFDTLKSQLTLPRMELLRGLGAMSDREFKTLSDSATALNRNMSEGAFMKELGNIKKALGDSRSRLAVQLPGPGTPGGGKVKMRAPDGQEMDVEAALVEHFKSRGAKVVR